MARAARKRSIRPMSMGGRYASRKRIIPGAPATRSERRPASGGAFPQLARRGREDLPDRRVELPDAGEPGGERDLGQRQRGGFGEHARGLGPLRAGQGERPCPEFGGHRPVDLALAVAQPPREPGDALPVHHAVADQPHRAAGQVGAEIPFGRAGRRVRVAALARAEARLLGRRGAGVKAHVRALRGDRGAAGPAIDPGRGDRDEEDAVEPGVFADRRLVPLLVVHASSLPARDATVLAGIGHLPGRPPGGSRW